MSTVEQSIDVDAPIATVYDQWTQFEEFPQFMAGVEEIRQIDDRHLHWVAEFGGSRHEWDAEITEQHPEERVAWRNTDGKDNAGVVTFHKIADERTRVMVRWIGRRRASRRRSVARLGSTTVGCRRTWRDSRSSWSPAARRARGAAKCPARADPPRRSPVGGDCAGER